MIPKSEIITAMSIRVICSVGVEEETKKERKRMNFFFLAFSTISNTRYRIQNTKNKKKNNTIKYKNHIRNKYTIEKERERERKEKGDCTDNVYRLQSIKQSCVIKESSTRQ